MDQRAGIPSGSLYRRHLAEAVKIQHLCQHFLIVYGALGHGKQKHHQGPADQSQHRTLGKGAPHIQRVRGSRGDTALVQQLQHRGAHHKFRDLRVIGDHGIEHIKSLLGIRILNFQCDNAGIGKHGNRYGRHIGDPQRLLDSVLQQAAVEDMGEGFCHLLRGLDIIGCHTGIQRIRHLDGESSTGLIGRPVSSFRPDAEKGTAEHNQHKADDPQPPGLPEKILQKNHQIQPLNFFFIKFHR